MWGADGELYVADIGNASLRQIKDGQVTEPAAVIIHSGHLWIADLKNHRIIITKWREG